MSVESSPLPENLIAVLATGDSRVNPLKPSGSVGKVISIWFPSVKVTGPAWVAAGYTLNVIFVYVDPPSTSATILGGRMPVLSANAQRSKEDLGEQGSEEARGQEQGEANGLAGFSVHTCPVCEI